MSATPLFVDTGGFYAAYVEDDANHTRARDVFELIQSRSYAPIYTSRYVLAELVTTIVYRKSHRTAAKALSEIRASDTINILPVGADVFDTACTMFERYDDHAISLIDHLSVVLASEYDISHIFAFDSDFATLGLTRVPVDTAEG